MKDLQLILAKCKTGDRQAQKSLYDFYSPLFCSICLRYIKNSIAAEDVMIQGFYKIFKNINQFQDKGSFEGWMKRIIVNESLMYLRQRKNFNLSLEQSHFEIHDTEELIQSKIEYQELLELLSFLPDGYRTIFNMYVIEGYKHREIAEALGISINTSKSQLIQAKKKVKELIKKKHPYKSAN